MDDPPEVSILLLGDTDVGKSTFLSRISKGTQGLKGPISLLRDGDQPFIFEIKLFARPYRFEFYDTASPESWKLLAPNMIVLCYDISSRSSLFSVQKLWAAEIKRAFSEQEFPVLLLGLKRDLRHEDDPNGIIYPQEGYRIAQEMRCDKYMECSAVTGELVHEVFEDICRTAAMTTKDEGGQSQGGCLVM